MTNGPANWGFTGRAVALSLLVLLMMAVLIQVVGVLAVGETTSSVMRLLGAGILPVPVLVIFLPVLAVSGLIHWLSRRQLFSRGELLVVLYAALLAAPLMTHGFWRPFLGLSSRIVASSSFEKYDALPARLWPHGPNLLADLFAPDSRWPVTTVGTVAWTNFPTATGRRERLPVLRNTRENAVAAVRVTLPVEAAGAAVLAVDQPYLVTALAHATDLGARSQYYCQVTFDDEPGVEEVFADRAPAKPTRLLPDGFVRVGRYALIVPRPVQRQARFEFGLVGPGTVIWRDPQLLNVNALETAYRAGRLITRARYDELAPGERAGLIVLPDRWLSRDGLRFLIAGQYPWRDWLPPVARWAAFGLLILTATFAFAVLMRRHWVENERYALPLAQISQALIGEEPNPDRPFARLWGNRWLWFGFAVAFGWCLMMGWHSINPGLPDLQVNISLKPYFVDPRWGRTWDGVVFTLSPLALAIGLFLELNVLASLVVGYFLFRFQFWFGEARGLTADRLYPYAPYQQTASYVGYALLVLGLTRQYFAHVLRRAWQGGAAEGEPLTYRTAVLVLVATFGGAWAWARWCAVPAPGVLILFTLFVLFGIVATKLRAECGATNPQYLPTDVWMVLPLLGGLGAFGPTGLVFAAGATLVFVSQSFYNVTGLQLELIELGRRFQLPRRHTLYICLLGIGGGLVVGGWVYLSGLHAIGAENYRVYGEFAGQDYGLKTLSEELAGSATTADSGTAATGPARFITPPVLAAAYGAGGTVAVTLLRQWFAGFWFHPAGFILGPTPMLRATWGSLLVAMAIRWVVLKLGGAAAVRNHLRPVAIGLVAGTMAAYLPLLLLNIYRYFLQPGSPGFGVMF